MDLVPIVEIVEFDGAAIVAGAVVQAARVKDSFASTVVVIVSTNVAVDLVDGAFVKLHAGLLFDPIFELDVRGLIVLDVIEGFLAVEVERGEDHLVVAFAAAGVAGAKAHWRLSRNVTAEAAGKTRTCAIR